MKDNEIYIKNLKILFEASRKIIARELKDMNEVEMWVWSHPDFMPTDHDISFGISHLHILKHYFN